MSFALTQINEPTTTAICLLASRFASRIASRFSSLFGCRFGWLSVWLADWRAYRRAYQAHRTARIVREKSEREQPPLSTKGIYLDI